MVEDGARSTPSLPRVMRCVLLHPPPCKTLHFTTSLFVMYGNHSFLQSDILNFESGVCQQSDFRGKISYPFHISNEIIRTVQVNIQGKFILFKIDCN